MHTDNHFENIQKLSKLMDNQFSFLGFKFGLDPIIGLIPFFGDVVSVGFSAYVLWYSNEQGLPVNKQLRMIFNTLADFGIGMIPLIGDASDFVIKSHKKNFEMLKEHMQHNRILEGEIIK